MLACIGTVALCSETGESQIDRLIRLYHLSFSKPSGIKDILYEWPLMCDSNGVIKKEDEASTINILFSPIMSKVCLNEGLAKTLMGCLHRLNFGDKRFNLKVVPLTTFKRLLWMYPSAFKIEYFDDIYTTLIDAITFFKQLIERLELGFSASTESRKRIEQERAECRASIILSHLVLSPSVALPPKLLRVGSPDLDSLIDLISKAPLVKRVSLLEQVKVTARSVLKTLAYSQELMRKQCMYWTLPNNHNFSLPKDYNLYSAQMFDSILKFNHELEDYRHAESVNAMELLALPEDVIVLITSHLDDLMALNDLMLACKFLHRNRYLREAFVRLVPLKLASLLTKAAHLFDHNEHQFVGSWQGRNIFEVFSLLCKTVMLSRISSVDLVNLSTLYLNPHESTSELCTQYMAYFSRLFVYMLTHYKFNNREHYKKVFAKLSILINSKDNEKLQPNVHFSKVDALYSYSFSHDFMFQTVESALTAKELSMDISFQDRISLCPLFFSTNEDVKTVLNLWYLANSPNQSLRQNEYLIKNISLIKDYFSERVIQRFAVIIVESIVSDKKYENLKIESRLLCKHIIRHLLSKQYDTDTVKKIFSALLVKEYTLDSIELDMIETALE